MLACAYCCTRHAKRSGVAKALCSWISRCSHILNQMKLTSYIWHLEVLFPCFRLHHGCLQRCSPLRSPLCALRHQQRIGPAGSMLCPWKHLAFWRRSLICAVLCPKYPLESSREQRNLWPVWTRTLMHCGMHLHSFRTKPKVKRLLFMLFIHKTLWDYYDICWNKTYNLT